MGNDWDWPDATGYDFQRYLDEKSMPQVEEILTQYGDLCMIWFDVPETLSRVQSEAFVKLVRRCQSGCLISGRIGNGLGDYETPDDNCIAKNPDPMKLYETVGTMNNSWGYCPTDTHYRSVKDILGIKEKCRSRASEDVGACPPRNAKKRDTHAALTGNLSLDALSSDSVAQHSFMKLPH